MSRMLASLTLLSLLSTGAQATTIEFSLLTWNDAQADSDRPSAVGLKPAQSSQTCDWLIFTDDDYIYAAGWNPFGALSHNIADPVGDGGSEFAMAPSLTCAGPFRMVFSHAGGDAWDVSLTHQAYSGQATPFAEMNQFLVSPGDPATQGAQYAVDGLPNQGIWLGSPADNWSLSYTLDFYLATNTDGNGDPLDIDATFDDCLQAGYLIPASELTETGLDSLDLDDPAGFYGGDFKTYILTEIVPRLPVEATALLITQMQKSHPVFTDMDVSIGVNSLVGNTTVAYTTDTLPLITCVPGDMNADENVDGRDVRLFKAAIIAHSTVPHDVCAGDFSDNGVIDLADVAGMVDTILGS